MRGFNLENAIVIILFMAIVGAVIGGATNYLAIKMIFKPYNAKYIGSWRLPFTPGLIPKRREELAKQIGITVTNYLLTPEVLKKKVITEDVRQTVLTFAQNKVGEVILTDEKTILDWIEATGMKHLPETVEGKVDHIITKQFTSVMSTLSMKTMEEVIPKQVHTKVEQKVPEFVSYLLEKGEDYLLSPKGELTIKNMMDDFLSSKGSFGGMIQMVLGDSTTVVGKIQKEMVTILKSPGARNVLVNIFMQEWNQLKKKPAMDYLSQVKFEPILENIQTYAKKELAIESRLNKPLTHYFPQAKTMVINEWLPKLVDKGFVYAEGKLEDVVKSLNLQEVIREQVDSFPLESLEEIVLGIASRELKMITWLGAVLGGAIGIVQGMIVLMLK